MNIRLSKIQREIVQRGEGALLVVAGPGSGKTRVLTERVRRLLAKNEGNFRILALTFTNKAANEMKERLEEFPDIKRRAFIGTLHSFCTEVLANRGKHLGIEHLPNIFELFQDRKQVLLQAVMTDPELRRALVCSGDSKEQDKVLNRWLTAIGECKNNLLVPEMVEDPILRRAYETYDGNLRASDALDFDDLLLLTYRLFTERPKIADFYRRQYRYICVDEAQDLNEAQYQVISALCGPNYRNVMMVGDPKQAIFVWNGANPKYLDLFQRDFVATKIAMDENFRSSRAVVKAAQCLEPGYKLEGQLPIPGSIKLFAGEDEQDEALKVLNYMGQLLAKGHKDIEGSVTLDRCALLGRTRYVLSAVEQELRKRKWPYFKQLSSQHESESTLLREFELCLRILANPRDRLHMGMLLRSWGMNLQSDELPSSENGLDVLNSLTLNTPSVHQKAVIAAIRAMGWTKDDFQFLSGMESLESFAERKIQQVEERALVIEDIKTWRKHWDAFLRAELGGKHSLTSFLSQVALGETQQPRQEGLALLTVHSAKGLEFDVVVVMGLADGTFPDYRAKGEALEEEKRNMFVAVTRSKRLLGLSYPKTKIMPWGDTWGQKPSPYLEILGLT
jgi:ATP-dependent DNA helicase UvrD/PcrA